MAGLSCTCCKCHENKHPSGKKICCKEHLLLTISCSEAGVLKTCASEELLIDSGSTPDGYTVEDRQLVFRKIAKKKLTNIDLKAQL